MEEVYKDSDINTPIIFVLSSGADPMGIMLRFAKKIKGENALDEGLHVISLG
jgi:dynein heavy chain